MFNAFQRGRWPTAISMGLAVMLGGCGGGGSGSSGASGLVGVQYQVTGLYGTGLQLSLTRTAPGASPVVEELQTRDADGNYEFTARLATDDAYEVAVANHPDGPSQECTVLNGAGVAGTETVTNVVIDCPTLQRKWWFGSGAQLGDSISNQQDDGVVDVRYDFPEPSGVGPQGKKLGDALGTQDEDIYKNLFDLPGTNMAVYSNRSGKTFWIGAEAPRSTADRQTRLRTRWWLRRTSSNATFKLQITDLVLDAFIDSAGTPFPSNQDFLVSYAQAGVSAYTVDEQTNQPLPRPFHLDTAFVLLFAAQAPDGTIQAADFDVSGFASGGGLFAGKSDFQFDRVVNADNNLAWLKLALRRNTDIEIDVSRVPLQGKFMVEMDSKVVVRNDYSPESHTVAYFRDPAQFDPGSDTSGGISVTEMTGLQFIQPGTVPDDFVPQPDETPAPACAAPNDPRGQLQFSAAAYRVSENDPTRRVVSLVRTGSTVGELTARVRMAPGTASAGQDYTPTEFFFRFPDGSTLPRSIAMPVIDDALAESPETIQLSLVDVAGCGDAGAQATATLTLLDDDTPAPQTLTFNIGGSVTGLAGSGLVIDNIGTDPLPIAANGAFQFPRTFAAGHIYRIGIVSQPQNPRQACTVSNGEGTVTTAAITNVQIACTTLSEPGGLDTGFGSGGRAWLADPSTRASDTALARQADGKLLVVTGGERLLRLLPNGAPDPAFGAAGDGSVTVTPAQRNDVALLGVAVQPDGRILVAGFASLGVSGRSDMMVARFLADGALDTSFAGGAGMATFDFGTWNDAASRVLVQADGRLLLAGRVGNNASNGDPTDFAVLRLTAAGQIDTAYGSNGWARANVAGGYDVPRGAVLTADGGVVLAGRVASSGGANGDVGLVKFTAAGQPDSAFGANGNGTVRINTTEHDEARDIVLMSDGRLLVVGERDVPGVPGAVFELWLARLLANGQLDTSFGSGGVATLATPMRGYAVAVQADGIVWAAGETPSANGSSADLGLARFTAAGQPDASFGNGGLLAVDLFGGLDTPGAMLLQPDGRLVIAGRADNGSTIGLGLVRVTP